jgi:hypothetical protein
MKQGNDVIRRIDENEGNKYEIISRDLVFIHRVYRNMTA